MNKDYDINEEIMSVVESLGFLNNHVYNRIYDTY